MLLCIKLSQNISLNTSSDKTRNKGLVLKNYICQGDYRLCDNVIKYAGIFKKIVGMKGDVPVWQ